MIKFAKIFETDKYGQILVMKSKDSDGDPQVEFKVLPKNMGVCTTAIGFSDTKNGIINRDKCFDGIEEDMAIRCVADIFNLTEDM